VTRVKFCGITNLEDAELCVEHGAWALGMIFVHSSPRRCKQSDALGIAAVMKRRVELVGVFQNPTLDHVTRTVDQLGLTIVQLHGDEGPSFAGEVQRRTGAKVIKAIRIRSKADVALLGTFPTDFHLLDGAGGQTFEWSLARERRSSIPLIAAGGLTPENVGDAIAALEPFAVDVASGIEGDDPRHKDPEKVSEFAFAVRQADPVPSEAPS
jgi:phosphoribosylanthranilate isomerase